MAYLTLEFLWWKARHPQVPILMAKRDIAEAFRWVWLQLEDSGLFATELPGDLLHIAEHIIAIFLVLSFGWLGSPGEYMALAWAIKEYVDAGGPRALQWALEHDELLEGLLRQLAAAREFKRTGDAVQANRVLGFRTPGDSVLPGWMQDDTRSYAHAINKQHLRVHGRGGGGGRGAGQPDPKAAPATPAERGGRGRGRGRGEKPKQT